MGELRGGKRKGAGRKPRATSRQTITVRLEPKHAQMFRVICKARGKSQSAQITDWIKQEK